MTAGLTSVGMVFILFNSPRLRIEIERPFKKSQLEIEIHPKLKSILNIHPIEKTLSGKKHKSLTMRSNGALGSVKTCLYS